MDPDDFESVLLREVAGTNYCSGHRKAKCGVCNRCTPTHCVCKGGVEHRLHANAKKRRNGALAIAAGATSSSLVGEAVEIPDSKSDVSTLL